MSIENEQKLLLNALVDLAENVDNHYESTATQEDRKYRGRFEGAYPYIPLCNKSFIGMLLMILNIFQALKSCPYFKNKQYRPPFLDVGCGIGTKVFLAHSLGFKAHGIELRSSLVEKAHSFLPKWSTCVQIKEQDALTFRHYSQYDVVYFYCPMCDNAKEKKLEKRIYDQMHRGAIVVPCMRNLTPRPQSFIKVIIGYRHLYIKKPRSNKTLKSWIRRLEEASFQVREDYEINHLTQ